MDYIIPAVVIVIANLTSGKHGSNNYEIWTAVFGYVSGISFVIAIVTQFFTAALYPYLYQIAIFCMITAISRDYEKLLKPFFNNLKRRNEP